MRQHQGLAVQAPLVALGSAQGDHVRAGTGLGLAIARGFFEAMHGTITASNVLTFPRVSAT